MLALAVTDNDEDVRQSFRFEIWDGKLVIVGESNQDADLAIVQSVGAGAGHVRVLLHLDQDVGPWTLDASPTGTHADRLGKAACVAIDGR